MNENESIELPLQLGYYRFELSVHFHVLYFDLLIMKDRKSRIYLKLRRELAWIEKKMKKMEWMKRPFGKEMEESDGGDG